MPVDFLTDEQALRYGTYHQEPSEEQLHKYFQLDDFDLETLQYARGGPQRLGMALQLTTLRFLGTFPRDVRAIPRAARKFVARQLGVDSRDLNSYSRRPSTISQQQAMIREKYGYGDYHDPKIQVAFQKFLRSRAYLTAESLTVLFDLATVWLVERKVPLPGVSVLTRLVASLKEEADEKLFSDINQHLTGKQREGLDLLVADQEESRGSRLDALRRAPIRDSASGLHQALLRLKEIRENIPESLALPEGLPLRRLQVLADYGMEVKSKFFQRMLEVKRYAVLQVTLFHLEKDATDDCLEIFQNYMERALGKLEREYFKERLSQLPTLDQASVTLRNLVLLMFDETIVSLEELRKKAAQLVPRNRLDQALEAVTLLTRSREDTLQEDLQRKYNSIRQFLPTMTEVLPFESTTAGRGVLDLWHALVRMEGRKKVLFSEVPTQTLEKDWKGKLKNEDGTLNRKAYTVAVLERLWESIKRRDIFITRSHRYQDPTAKLMTRVAWENQKQEVCQSLNLTPDPEPFLEGISRELHLHYLFVAGRLKKNPHLKLELSEDKKSARPQLEPLEALPEGESLIALRKAIKELLPRVDLPELLLEVHSWTGFLNAFRHISEANSRAADVLLSICAVITGEACNIGMEPVSHRYTPALSPDRLSWVNQNYVRAETLTEANALLVNLQKDIPLAQEWGGGQLASVDGLRFKVPVRSIHARANPKYFGHGRGVTYLNYVSDYGTGFHGIVVPGTLRDSMFVLDGLLEQNTQLQPVRITSDTHSLCVGPGSQVGEWTCHAPSSRQA